MRVDYIGTRKYEGYKYRLAEITYDQDDKSEQLKVSRIVEGMRTRGWDIDNSIAGWAACEVSDMEEYNEFKKDWKEVKKVCR